MKRPCSRPFLRCLDPRGAAPVLALVAACRGQPVPEPPGRADGLPPARAATTGLPPAATTPSIVSCLAGAPPVVARVAGAPVRLDEVAPAVAFQVYQRQVDVYGLLAREVERLADARLLEAEAGRRGTTAGDIVEQAMAAAPPVTDGDVDRYLREQPPPAGIPDVRGRARAYLVERGREERRLALLERLRREAGVELLVPAPVAPRVHLELAGAPARGPEGAPVTVVHFASFSSAASARSAAMIARLVGEHPGRIRWVHRTALAPYDERGLRAAAAGLAAFARGPDAFWKLHDRLFALEGSWTDAQLDAVLRDLGLAEPASALVARRLADVKREVGFASELGLEAPPVVFVNGRYFSPTYPFSELERMVGEELAAPRP